MPAGNYTILRYLHYSVTEFSGVLAYGVYIFLFIPNGLKLLSSHIFSVLFALSTMARDQEYPASPPHASHITRPLDGKPSDPELKP
jgi:hypothetical protein